MLRVLGKSRLACLNYRSAFGAYIHMRDHDKKINAKGNRLPLSFRDPSIYYEGAPISKPYKMPLRTKANAMLEKAIFD